jgi:transposase-like protein
VRSKRLFATDLQNEANRILLDEGYSMDEVCAAMGFSETSMALWVHQLCAERGGLTPVASQALLEHQAITPEQLLIQQLEAKVQKLEHEKNVLKEFTAFLMSDASSGN